MTASDLHRKRALPIIGNGDREGFLRDKAGEAAQPVSQLLQRREA